MTKKDKGFDFVWTPKSNGQRLAREVFRRSRILFLTGPAGSGKAQPLDSIVWTPTGPINMGSIKVGDKVCTPNGGITTVLAVFPQGKKKVYEIEFDNGNKVKACGEHLWEVNNLYHKTQIVDTITLKNSIKVGKNNRRNWYIKPNKGLYLTKQEVPLDPYLLGILLGDGHLSRKHLAYSTADKELLDALIINLPPNMKVKHLSRYDYRLTGTINTGGQKPNSLVKALVDLNLINTKSNTKFIPKIYKYNSYDVRLAILQGLLDTDGSVCKKKNGKGNGVEFSSTSEQLARDVKEVAESLGAIVSFVKKKTSCLYKGKYVIGEAYRSHITFPSTIQPFRLTRKKEHHSTREHTRYRWIESIKEIGEEECQCILVEDKNHLYVTDNAIPTHNTSCALGLILTEIFKPNSTLKLKMARPAVGVNNVKLPFTPGDTHTKLLEWFAPIFDVLEDMSSDSFEKLEKTLGPRLELLSIPHIRGRTVKNGFLLVDESQNLTFGEMKSILTRVGEGGRIVLTGDLDQSDLYDDPLDSPLAYAISRLKDVDTINHVKFGPSDQLRDPLVTEILARI